MIYALKALCLGPDILDYASDWELLATGMRVIRPCSTLFFFLLLLRQGLSFLHLRGGPVIRHARLVIAGVTVRYTLHLLPAGLCEVLALFS